MKRGGEFVKKLEGEEKSKRREANHPGQALLVRAVASNGCAGVQTTGAQR